MPVPYIPKKTEIKILKRPLGWPSQSPFSKDQAIVFSNKSFGKKIKSCPVNSQNKTVFKER